MSEKVDILIADDRPENLLALEAVLSHPDHNVVTATTGAEVLRKVLKHDFAVILLDVRMPAMDGFETARLIADRDASRNIPILFLTAAGTDVASVHRGYASGAVDYLIKPIEPEIVRAKVGIFVDLHRRSRRLLRREEALREAERTRADGILRQREAEFEAVFENAAIGMAQVGFDGRWLRVNQKLCEILGDSRERVLGTTFQQLLDPDELQRHRVALQQLLGGRRKSVTGEVRGTSADGRRLWIRATVSLQRTAGTPQNFVAVIEDVTDRKVVEERQRSLLEENARLYRQAQEAIAARDEFLSIASHELRTPLTPLLIQMKRLLGVRGRGGLERMTPAEIRTVVEGSSRQVMRISSLIDSLLDVSRITAGRLTLEVEQVDLAEAAREIAVRFADDTVSGGPAIEVRAAGEAVIWCDRLRFEQVLSNLIANAVKYGAGEPIEVVVEPDDESVAVSVRDHGIGIPADRLPRIFDRFERAVTSRAYGGLGLGLFIVRQIVEAHGGTIAVDSEPERGSTFTVRLPRRQSAERSVDRPVLRDREEGASAPPPDCVPAPATTQTVLVVEDDRDILDCVSELLSQHGYRVQVATNGREALARLEDPNPPAAILLDLRMPVMNGWEFRAKLQSSPGLDRIPMVVMSGDANVPEKARALDADGYLKKPFDATELLALVERVCLPAARARHATVC